MVKHFISALAATLKSGFGLVGAILAAAGALGHTLVATSVTPWVCVIGLALFAAAALWELAKSLYALEAKDDDLKHSLAKAWEMEKDRDRWRGRHADLQNMRWASFPPSTGASPSTASGHIESSQQEELRFRDPGQGHLLAEDDE